MRKLLGNMPKKEDPKTVEISVEKTIDFKKHGDGIDPGRAPWGYIGRLPVSVLVDENDQFVMKIGVSSSAPILAWPTVTWPDIVPTKTIFQPHEEITVLIKNSSALTKMQLETGEPVVCLHPLIF